MLRSHSIYLLLLVVLLAGCVSKADYQRKSDEAAHLVTARTELEHDYSELLDQQQQLAQRYDQRGLQLEEANNAINNLRQNQLRATTDIERLEKVLSERSASAGAAMKEMRQTIDSLEELKRDLTAQLKKEQLARQARIAAMKTTYDQLVETMENEIERGEITISDLQGQLTVNLVEKLLFASGEADLKTSGAQILQRVGDILKEVTDKEIRVEGHTDNISISPRLQQTFASNWELSTARATNVVHFLQKRKGIPGSRLSICGYGPYQPIASNDTATGRAQNRRIQIVLIPRQQPVK
ncbi:MAG: OmpA family protein [Desulfuromonadaceae bacterium]|nr:OmpA family protein [Desulfuromonadaceae bacterium]